jgi:hypothetical protein
VGSSHFVAVAPDDLESESGPETLGRDHWAEALHRRWPAATVADADGDANVRLRFHRSIHDDIALQSEHDCFAFQKADPAFFAEFAAWFRDQVPAQLRVVAFDDQGNLADIAPQSSPELVRDTLVAAGVLP